MDNKGADQKSKFKLGTELKSMVEAIEQIGDAVNKNAYFMSQMKNQND